MVMKVLCMCYCVCVVCVRWLVRVIRFRLNSNQSEMNVYRLINSMCANLASLLYYAFRSFRIHQYFIWFGSFAIFTEWKVRRNQFQFHQTHTHISVDPKCSDEHTKRVEQIQCLWHHHEMAKYVDGEYFITMRTQNYLFKSSQSIHKNSVVCLFWQAFLCCIAALVASCAQIFCCVCYMSNKWNDSLTHRDVCVCFFVHFYILLVNENAIYLVERVLSDIVRVPDRYYTFVSINCHFSRFGSDECARAAASAII